MSAKDIVLGAASGGAASGGAAAGPTYVDDVFSTYLYTGNGSTQTITNGIDLAGNGGMVWSATRVGAENNGPEIIDTNRGGSYRLLTSTTQAAYNCSDPITFNNNGFSMSPTVNTYINYSGYSKVAWTFRKAPKFFDIVTWTGDGNTYPASRTLNHSLGIAPGMIVIKVTSATDDWVVYHAGLPSPTATYLRLNTTEAARSGTIIDQVTSTSFRITDQLAYGADSLNQLNQTYVAYVFAHNTAADSMIKCGSYTGNGSATGPVVNLGWEVQWVMVKKATGGAGNWLMFDVMRGMTKGNDAYLSANTSDAESSAFEWLEPNATGFNITVNNGNVNTLNETYIYMAIRRPNKPPTTGTQVFTPTKGLNASGQVFPANHIVDFFIGQDVGFNSSYFQDRLRGAPQYLAGSTTDAENTSTDWRLDTNKGVNYASVRDLTMRMAWLFKRAPGFFDVVCYTGNAAVRAIPHNLAAVPELVIVKNRNASGVGNWIVWHTFFGVNGYMVFSSGTLSTYANYFPTLPTATNLNVGNGGDYGGVNAAATNYVAYMFATLAGISKVGSYTGNGSSQTINCGFAAGARFILIRQTNAAGDWYVWDTARGIAAANDPHLSLNTTAAEVTTDDSIDPDSTGFIVNQVAATNINVTSATYIYLAIS